MKIVIEEIVKRSANNLRCFWTFHIPYLKFDANLFNWNEMIACNHLSMRQYQMHLPPKIESCDGDWFNVANRGRDKHDPTQHLKQIDCTYQLQVIYWFLSSSLYIKLMHKFLLIDRFFFFFTSCSIGILFWKGWNLTLLPGQLFRTWGNILSGLNYDS